MPISNSFIFGLFFVLAIMTVIGFFLQSQLIARLRENQHEEWLDMGSPTLFLNNSIRSTFQQIRFVHGSASLKLKDSRLFALCRVIRLFDYVYLGIFFTLIVSTFMKSAGQSL